MSALTDDVQAFRHYIRAERGLADNTLLAYTRDLERFARWADNGGLADYLFPTLRELAGYLSFRREDEELAPPSVARHLVALKVFYRFLRLEERTTQGTVDLLASPTLWERIPQVLSPDSVDKLLNASDRFTRLQLIVTDELERAEREHAEIVALCRRGAFAPAAAALRRHISGVKDALVKFLAERAGA